MFKTLAVPMLLSFGLLAAAIPTAHAKNSCSTDIKTFCKGAKKQPGGVSACLEKHAAELSAPCREKRQKMAQKKQDMQLSCNADLPQYCSAKKTLKGQMKCLKKNRGKVSPSCKDFLVKSKAKKTEKAKA
jgi:hypothetical protein